MIALNLIPVRHGLRFQQVDIRVRVKGGGTTAQIYAIRQAIAKGMVAYYQKCKMMCRPTSVLAVPHTVFASFFTSQYRR